MAMRGCRVTITLTKIVLKIRAFDMKPKLSLSERVVRDRIADMVARLDDGR